MCDDWRNDYPFAFISLIAIRKIQCSSVCSIRNSDIVSLKNTKIFINTFEMRKHYILDYSFKAPFPIAIFFTVRWALCMRLITSTPGPSSALPQAGKHQLSSPSTGHSAPHSCSHHKPTYIGNTNLKQNFSVKSRPTHSGRTHYIIS